MKLRVFSFFALFAVAVAISMSLGTDQSAYRKWQKITLNFQGPQTSEMDADNPFLNYRLNVTFTLGDRSYLVPGFYAGDGNAAETSASAGSTWQVRFVPDAEGEWQYEVSFRHGDNIAISDEPDAGKPVYFDGEKSSIQVLPVDKSSRHAAKRGRVQYVNKRYLEYAETGKPFLKGGADSPEDFLGYEDFDSTYSHGEKNYVKTYEPHIRDWHKGNPTWQQGKGKGMIGALNYLASQGMNAVYFLTLNINGDGKNVWPFVSHTEFSRFDCSKLDQWEIVFDHMDSLGLMSHMVTQETENQCLFDNCETGPQRALYYRELIARFGHHLALTWNLGEESGRRYREDGTPRNVNRKVQNDAQFKAMATYLRAHDPYKNPVVIHSHVGNYSREHLLQPLLGFKAVEGPSLQVKNTGNVYAEVEKWIRLSQGSGKPWVVALDENGPAAKGVVPDAADPGHDTIRMEVLWPTLMAGGAGVEWYFGYNYPNSDLTCQDWRSRENMWEQTNIALDFFRENLPFQRMEANQDFTSIGNYYGFSDADRLHVVYFSSLRHAASFQPKKGNGTYEIRWFNPREGGRLLAGTVLEVDMEKWKGVGSPTEKAADSEDWVMVLKRK